MPPRESEEARPRGERVAPALAVALVWLGATWWAAAFVLRHASPVPTFDDLDTATHLLDHGVSARWLVAPHNEHRIVLPRLLYAGVLAVTGDVRAVALFSVALVSLLAAAQVAVAASARGRVAYTDVVFPLVWLHGGHAANQLTPFAITLGTSTVLASAALLVAVARPAPPGLGRALLFGACLVALPLTSAVGAAQAPVLAAWALAAALALSGVERARAARRVLVGTAILALLAALALVIDLGPARPAAEVPLAARLDTAARALALAIGSPGALLWPASAVVIGGLVVLSLGPPLAALRRPSERLRAAALLAAALGTAAVLGAVALGRGGAPLGGWPARYAGLATPLLATAYLAWVLHGSPGIARFAQAALAAGALALFGLATPGALDHGRAVRASHELLARDARGGMGPRALAAEHLAHGHFFEEGLARGLAVLRAHGRPPFEAGVGVGDGHGSDGSTGAGAAPAALSEDALRAALGAEIVSVRSARPPRRGVVDGAPVLLVHGATELDLGAVRGPRTLRGRFGIPAPAYQLNETEGLVFRVELREGAARFPLAERELDPRARPNDRGAQALDARIEAGRRGRLVLVTRPRGGAAQPTDWGFWTALEIERDPR